MSHEKLSIEDAITVLESVRASARNGSNAFVLVCHSQRELDEPDQVTNVWCTDDSAWYGTRLCT